MRWSVVVPVKVLRDAKSRLSPLDAGRRRELALAMALDTISAVLACPEVEQVVVVTDDETAANAAEAVGARVVPDAPDAGLNAALVFGADAARRSRGEDAVAAVASDLPALKPAELTAVLAAAARHTRAVVGDADGAGTVLLTAGPDITLDPAYGPASLQRHRASGAMVLDTVGPGIRRDVDTLQDLREALRLGCGPRTTELARDLLD